MAAPGPKGYCTSPWQAVSYSTVAHIRTARVHFKFLLPLLCPDFFFICASLWIGHYQPIGLIPEGARNVQIKELSGFKNYLGELIFVTNTDLGFSKHLRCKEEFLLSINMVTCDENASTTKQSQNKRVCYKAVVDILQPVFFASKLSIHNACKNTRIIRTHLSANECARYIILKAPVTW